MVGVYFGNITKEGVLIEKGFKGVGFLNQIRGKGGGLGQICPFFLLPSTQNRGGVGSAGGGRFGRPGLDGGPG